MKKRPSSLTPIRTALLGVFLVALTVVPLLNAFFNSLSAPPQSGGMPSAGGLTDFHSFLLRGAPFLSLLVFCLFFLWYDEAPKKRYLINLGRYIGWGFTGIALWFLCRFLFPKPFTLLLRRLLHEPDADNGDSYRIGPQSTRLLPQRLYGRQTL